MLARLDDYFRVQESALKLRSARQEILASNIANADTPQYKARDFDFSSAFKAALSKDKNTGAPLTRSDSRHLQPKSSQDLLGVQVKYRSELQSSIDGNTVNMDQEMMAFTDNALRYQAALTFMQKRVEGMRNAIQGQ